ncbi:TonB-dependent receptor plug domain-containing protein, partial [Acinetobacter baumannii]
QTNGLPGSRFKALIRGQSSIQNGNSPLFIIDGVPFLSDNDALTQLNGMLANSPFNSLDPNDIESIEILKDADATAIYGSRGAN